MQTNNSSFHDSSFILYQNLNNGVSLTKEIKSRYTNKNNHIEFEKLISDFEYLLQNKDDIKIKSITLLDTNEIKLTHEQEAKISLYISRLLFNTRSEQTTIDKIKNLNFEKLTYLSSLSPETRSKLLNIMDEIPSDSHEQLFSLIFKLSANNSGQEIINILHETLSSLESPTLQKLAIQRTNVLVNADTNLYDAAQLLCFTRTFSENEWPEAAKLSKEILGTRNSVPVLVAIFTLPPNDRHEALEAVKILSKVEKHIAATVDNDVLFINEINDASIEKLVYALPKAQKDSWELISEIYREVILLSEYLKPMEQKEVYDFVANLDASLSNIEIINLAYDIARVHNCKLSSFNEILAAILELPQSKLYLIDHLQTILKHTNQVANIPGLIKTLDLLPENNIKEITDQTVLMLSKKWDDAIPLETIINAISSVPASFYPKFDFDAYFNVLESFPHTDMSTFFIGTLKSLPPNTSLPFIKHLQPILISLQNGYSAAGLLYCACSAKNPSQFLGNNLLNAPYIHQRIALMAFSALVPPENIPNLNAYFHNDQNFPENFIEALKLVPIEKRTPGNLHFLAGVYFYEDPHMRQTYQFLLSNLSLNPSSIALEDLQFTNLSKFLLNTFSIEGGDAFASNVLHSLESISRTAIGQKLLDNISKKNMYGIIKSHDESYVDVATKTIYLNPDTEGFSITKSEKSLYQSDEYTPEAVLFHELVHFYYLQTNLHRGTSLLYKASKRSSLSNSEERWTIQGGKPNWGEKNFQFNENAYRKAVGLPPRHVHIDNDRKDFTSEALLPLVFGTFQELDDRHLRFIRMSDPVMVWKNALTSGSHKIAEKAFKILPPGPKQKQQLFEWAVNNNASPGILKLLKGSQDLSWTSSLPESYWEHLVNVHDTALFKDDAFKLKYKEHVDINTRLEQVIKAGSYPLLLWMIADREQFEQLSPKQIMEIETKFPFSSSKTKNKCLELISRQKTLR